MNPAPRSRTTRSASAAAPATGQLAPPVSHAAGLGEMHAGPLSPRRSPRVQSRETPDDSARVGVKDESGSPSRRYALRLRSSASATPGPGDKGKGKGPAESTVLEIPDSSSEGDHSRAHAKAVLARSSPTKHSAHRTPAKMKKKTYKWRKGQDGRDELDLTLSSSPSTASTLGNDDDEDAGSDGNSEVVVVSYTPRADKRHDLSHSLTPRANKPPGSTLTKVKSGPHASIGPSSSAGSRAYPRLRPAAIAASAKGKEKETALARDAALMPARSPSSRKQSASGGASSPFRLPVGTAEARTPRSEGKQPAHALSPIVEVPVSQRARSLSNALHASAATPRVAVVAASPESTTAVSSDTQATPPRTSGAVQQTISCPSFDDSSALISLSSAPGAFSSQPIFAPSPRAAGPSTPHRAASLPSALASASASTPTAAATGASKLTASALRAVGLRTPNGGPAYIRDPSDSPLSSLAPTPPTPLSRAETWNGSGTAPRKTWREHAFELVIEAPPRTSASRSSRTVTPAWVQARRVGGGGLRRERDGPTSEWDAFMRDEDGSSDEEEEEEEEEDGSSDEEEERVGSPSPAKRGKARAAPESSASSSDADDSDDSGRSSDAEHDSDADDFAAMLAAAKAKRETGGALLASTSAAATSPTSAPTTVSLQLGKVAAADDADADEPRRSSRARHAADHFSPSKPLVTAASRPAAVAQQGTKRAAASLGLVAPSGGARACGLTFEKIMREKEAKTQRGRGQEWLEGWKKALETESADEASDEDLDARSDTSDELAPPSALARTNPLDAALVATALAAESDEDLPAPKAVTKRAREVERVLAEEREAERKRTADGETREARELRSVWRFKETGVSSLDAEMRSWDDEGWRGRIAQALRDGLLDPANFPSSFSLFLPLSMTGHGSAEDHRIVSRWLLSTITHPSTSAALADRLTALLHRIAMYTARSTASAASPLLTADDLVGALIRCGAKSSLRSAVAPSECACEVGDEQVDPIDVDEPTHVDDQVVADEDVRREIVGRWCRVVQALCAISPRLLSDADTVSTAGVCLRLSLDPTSATMRSTLGWTLRALLASMPDDSPARIDLFQRILALYGASRPRLQSAVLQALPHDSETNKGLRRWLASAFLANEKVVTLPPGGLSSSVLPRLLSLLASPPASSPFRSRTASGADEKNAASDTTLAECTRILFIALTSLDLALLASPSRADEWQTLDALLSYVQALDGRLRADARKGLKVERLAAKNLLTALYHSATYQLRRARGQAGAYGFSEEEEREALAQGVDGDVREPKKARVDDGPAVTPVSFRKPAAVSRASSASAGAGRPASSSQEIEELVRW